MSAEVENDLILTRLELAVDEIPQDEELMTELHNTFGIYMEPYVPMQEGMLMSRIKVDGEGIEYQSPYAHYQYTGLVYGPNIPIIKDGVIVGWWSPPNKQPTGKPITYNPEFHPLATHHWDQAMMKDYAEPFTSDLAKIITDYINKENNNGQE